MRVTCNRAVLSESIGLVSGVVASRTPRPQLTCVKIEAFQDPSRLVLSGTDAEISLSIRVDEVEVTEPGAALVPADKLSAIVRAEDGDATLNIETDAENVVHVRGADARFKIFGFAASEFPELTAFAALSESRNAVAFSHQAEDLTEIIARTVFATARENSRYAINGVLMKRKGPSLEMVATDGRRLALARSPIGDGVKDDTEISCIVPTKALAMINKLARAGDSVHVAIGDTQIAVAFGGDSPEDASATLVSSLIEATFPPYEDVIPKSHEIRAEFNRDMLASAIKRAALLTTEEARGVRLAFDANEKRLTITSRAPEMGEAEITLDCAEYSGDDIEIGFNPNYVIDALKIVGGDTATFELTAQNKPGVIRLGNEFVYVVMPVNL